MIVDALRPAWLSGLSNINGFSDMRFVDWLRSGEFYFDLPVGPDHMIVVLKPSVTLHSIFASEVSRFSTAAIETAQQISQYEKRPISLSWLIIRSYYAAFFAAHSLFRVTGVSCSRFEGPECDKVNVIATALGFSAEPLRGGSYHCHYEAGSGRIACRRVGGKGAHEDFWRVFDTFLVEIANGILSNAALTREDQFNAAGKLAELNRVLRSDGCNGGNWLSTVRNRVNYSHKYGVWFPYKNERKYCDDLFRVQSGWKMEPELIALTSADELRRFLLACSFLVSLCRATTIDMASRCSLGRSFLDLTSIRLLR
jgi:hypothetical protein